jgi:Gas vesicle synthesis protein GvpO
MSSPRENRNGNGHRDPAKSGRTAKPSPAALARRASNELAELIGREPEGVVSMERTEDGWRIGVEVLETRRIPDTADILAEYEVDADSRGRLVGYRRTRRYSRGSLQDD